MRWALMMIRLAAACRNTSVSRTTGTAPGREAGHPRVRVESRLRLRREGQRSSRRRWEAPRPRSISALRSRRRIGTPCAGAGSIDEKLSCRVNRLASLISSLGNLKKVQSSPNEEGEFFADALLEDRRNL